MTLYKKLIAVGLLLVAGQHHVVMALEPVSVELPEPSAQQQSLQDPDYPRYSTDKNMYEVSVVEQPAEPGVIIEPMVISDTTVGNYFNNGVTRTLITQETFDGKLITTTERWITRNPSYLTLRNMVLILAAIGGTAGVTYFVMQQQHERQKAQDLEKLENMLKKSEKYNNNFVKRTDFKAKQDKFDRILENTGASKFISVNSSVLTGLIDDFSEEQLQQLVETVKNKNKPLTTEDFIKIYETIHDVKPDNHVANFDQELLKFGSRYDDWGGKYRTAIHESAHGLVAAQQGGEVSPGYATIVGQPLISNGHMAFKPTVDWKLFYVEHDDKELNQILHKIDTSLAGPIGVSIAENKKLSFEELLDYERYGGGNFDRLGSDMSQAMQEAKDYFQVLNKDSWLPKTSNDQHEQDLLNLLKERYRVTYDYLQDHQKELAVMTNHLYQHGVVSSDKIHEIAQTPTPQSFDDLSERDQSKASGILNWLRAAANFHDTNGYQIHDIIG